MGLPACRRRPRPPVNSPDSCSAWFGPGGMSSLRDVHMTDNFEMSGALPPSAAGVPLLERLYLRTALNGTLPASYSTLR
jgi:hypothetical protein